MPSSAGNRSDPGRERTNERKCAEGASETGVRPKRLEENEAPSGRLLVTGGIACAMIELRGRARPKMPLKLYERGSASTDAAAARYWSVSD